jgi:hypothetical protein
MISHKKFPLDQEGFALRKAFPFPFRSLPGYFLAQNVQLSKNTPYFDLKPQSINRFL